MARPETYIVGGGFKPDRYRLVGNGWDVAIQVGDGDMEPSVLNVVGNGGHFSIAFDMRCSLDKGWETLVEFVLDAVGKREVA